MDAFAGIDKIHNSNLKVSSPLTTHYSLKRCAFTLAEVLITLGIIGVVAAMTLPSLVQKHQDKVTVVKLKKAYNILSNAYLYFKKDNDVRNIDTSLTEQGAKNVFEIFKPHLNIGKDCGTANDVSCGGGSKYGASNLYYKVLLNDGTGLIFRGESTGSTDDEIDYQLFVPLEVFVDVNGPKPPNQWGYDLFEFDEYGGRIVPTGSPSIPGMPSFEGNCAKKDSSHYGCTAWIILNENLDYKYCEDLSWDGKKKCK